MGKPEVLETVKNRENSGVQKCPENHGFSAKTAKNGTFRISYEV